MDNPSPRPETAPWRLPLCSALAVVVFLTPLAGRKNGYTVDANAPFQITRSIVEDGVWFPSAAVKQGYIHSVVFVPFYAMAELAQSMFPGAVPESVHRNFMCWMNTVVTGAAAGVMALVLRELGHSRAVRAALPLAWAFSTLAFNYARYEYNKALAGLLLILAFYAWLRFNRMPRWRNALGLGCAMGMLAALRLEMAAVLPAFALGMVWMRRRTENFIRLAVIAAVPAAAGILFVIVYNAMYWGAGLGGGYEGSFSLNPGEALAGFLFSPGKSVFLFNPILLLLPLALRPFIQTQPRERAVPLLLGLGLLVSVYAFWGNWWGGWGYGPRHLVPLLPLACVPLAALLDGGGRPVWTAFGALALAGFAVQLVGAAIDFNDVIYNLMLNGIAEHQLIWNAWLNPVYRHALFLSNLPPGRWDFAIAALIQNGPPAAVIAAAAAWIGSLAALGAWLRRLASPDAPAAEGGES